MRKLYSFLSSILLVVLPILAETAIASNSTTDDNRLKNCGTVLKSVLEISEDIPQDLLDRSDCVVVIPNVLRATHIDGGSYGRGAMTCRQGEDFNGPWGAPTMMVLEGGNFGYQIDGKTTDLVLLVMNEAGANAVLGNEVKLGADASSAAGPVGHELATESCEVQQAEFLSYARARGSFAGVSLAGTTIRPDNGNNHRLYGRKILARDITLSGTVAATPAAGEMISTLENKTPKHRP